MPVLHFALLLVLPVVVAAVVVGVRTGGLRALLTLRLRHKWLIAAAAVVQFVRTADPAWAAAVLRPGRGAAPVVVIWLLVTTFAALNLSRGRAAMTLFVTGLTMNTAAILANGGMPYAVPAARIAGYPEAELARDVLNHPQLTPDSHLMLLADVIPVPDTRIVASLGDLLIFAGLSWLLITLVAREDRSRARILVGR